MDESSNQLFERVSLILEQAKSSIVYSVNHNTVLANWLIGREIVLELQRGEERAEYGTQLLESLSLQLKKRFGSGFSVANLKNFRQFYLTFQDRIDPIRYPPGSELPSMRQIEQKSYPAGGESAEIASVAQAEKILTAFSPRLSWSHFYPCTSPVSLVQASRTSAAPCLAKIRIRDYASHISLAFSRTG